MAKKARTPAPPRKVQAPQKRSSKSGRTSAHGAGGRRTMLIVIGIAVALVAAGAVAAGVVLTTGGGKSSQQSVDATMVAAGCTIHNVAAKSRQHVSSLNTKIKYNTTPPSNGSHYFTPAIWDFYTTPANPIQVVHNEEHGGVILWWGNRVPTSTVSKIRDFYQSSPNAVLGTPYPALGSKVAVTAWTAPSGGMGMGHAAVCRTFDENAFTAFRNAYRGKGPERFPVSTLTPGT